MSLSVNGQVRPLLVVDDRMQFEHGGDFAVARGGSLIQYRTIPSQNYSSSGSNITYNVQPPSPAIAISRKIMTKFYYQVSITATAGASGYVIDPGVYDAPRFMPTQQVISNMSATINSATCTLNNYQVINAFSRIGLSDMNIGRDWSLAPSMRDGNQNYSDVYTQGSAVSTFFKSNQLGVVNDPLQSLGETPYSMPSRGGFPVEIVSNPQVGVGVSGTAVVQFASTEPLLVSPFCSVDDDYALINVQTLTLNINMANLQRVWSHSDSAEASTITAISCILYQAPEVQTIFLTPSPLQTIPRSVVYNYKPVNVYTTDYATSVSPGAQFTINTNNIQLPNVPSRVIFFARASDSQILSNIPASVSYTDTFAGISNLSVQFDNNSGLFASASPEALYLLAREAGVNLSWTEWTQTVGAVMVLDPGRNMPLTDPYDAPSVLSTKQLQITATMRNLNQVKSLMFTAYVLVISDGLITISDNTTIQQETVLSREDVLKTYSEPIKLASKVSNSFYGGISLKSFIRGAKNVTRALDKYKPLSKLAKAAQHFGVPGSMQAEAAAHELGYGLTGRGLVKGGGIMTKSALKHRMDEEDEDYDEDEY